MLRGNDFLWEGGSATSLSDNQWFWTDGILYVASPEGNPDLEGLPVEVAVRDHAIDIAGKPYVTIDGLHLEMTRSAALRMIDGCDYSVVKNCTMIYANSATVDAAGIHNKSNTFCVFDNLYMDFMLGDGILNQASRDITVQNCHIQGIYRGKNPGGDAVQFFSNSHRPKILNNFMSLENSNVGKGCLQLDFPTDGAIIRGNTFLYGNLGAVVSGSDMLVEYNTFAYQGVNNPQLSWPSGFRFGGSFSGAGNYKNVNVQNNSFYGHNLHAINIVDGNVEKENFNFYNNTIYNCGGGFRYEGAMSGNFKNNIIWSPNASLSVYIEGSVIEGYYSAICK